MNLNPSPQRAILPMDGEGKWAMHIRVALSQKRADSVMAYLAAGGVAQTRMWAKGYGKDREVRDCAETSCKVQNRRVGTNLQHLSRRNCNARPATVVRHVLIRDQRVQGIVAAAKVDDDEAA